MVGSRTAYFEYLASNGTSYEALEHMPRAELEQFQLELANRLYDEISANTKALARVAGNVGFSGARSHDDFVSLLFPHTAYKSYSLEWLERGDFARLTKWMQTFTTITLSDVDVSGVSSVDQWIELLDRETDLRIAHTFGTSGKLSFIPRSRQEWDRGRAMLMLLFRDFFGKNSGPDFRPGDLPVIFPSHRHGANASARGVDGLVKDIAGSDENALFLYPDERFSADVAAFAGILKNQQANSADAPRIPEGLLERQREFMRLQEQRPEKLERFLSEIANQYSDQSVYIFLLWPMAVDWAEACLARGMSHMFGPNTIFHTGGGTKGRDFKPGWRERVLEFLGVEKYHEFYGMTEVYPPNIRCEVGNYHINKMIMPFLLDPNSGMPLPRTGEQTGRFAALDLNATTMWGGFITGDRVTMGGWERPCSCGREGIYVDDEIARFSELQGGGDKISCAAAPDAHESALKYLAEQLA